MKIIYYYETKIGKLGIVQSEEKITNIYVADKLLTEGMEVTETPLIKDTIKQIEEYLEGKRVSFNIPIDPGGTEFQRKVWNELKKIPYGETKSYKDIAEKLGNPGAARAIGMANNKNPILIIIPCHRIIGKDGSLVGYAGGLDMKKQLLKIERENNND